MPTQATTTTSPDATKVLTTWLNRKFVSDLDWTLQHVKLTQKAVLPPGSGNIARFIQFAPPGMGAATSSPTGTLGTSYTGISTTALTEGSATQHEITAITTLGTDLTIVELGEWLRVSELYDLTAVAGTRERLSKRLRDGAAVTIDSLVATQALASTQALYSQDIRAGASTTVLAITPAQFSAALVMSARKVLVDNLAQGFEGVPGITRGHFACVITPKQELDIITEVTAGRVYWSQCVTNVPGVMGQDKFVNGYIGSIYGVDVLVTTNYAKAQVTGASSDVAICYADGGVGALSAKDMDPQIIINDINSPFKNVNSIAWHAYFVAGLLSSQRIVKLYSAS